ncbi:MAG: hypothetical protein FWC64_01045, partial [Treponema sp.]|nr:hypothetical protein [Treponema sp.]
IVAVIGFGMTACDNAGSPTNNNNGNGETRTVTVNITGTGAGGVTHNAPATILQSATELAVTLSSVPANATVTATGGTVAGGNVVTFTFTAGASALTFEITVTAYVPGVTPTVILTPASVTINDGNLTETVNVTGTATGDVTLDASALPANVTATVSGTEITVTGVRQSTAVSDTFIVGVTRQGITQNLSVTVNLTAVVVPDLFAGFAPGLYDLSPEALLSAGAATTPIQSPNDGYNIVDAIDHVNDNAAVGTSFTLLIDDDVAVAGSATRGLNVAGANLTIIGIGGERRISLSSAGRMFTVGAAGQAGISLTIGNNITLVGHSANNQGVVRAQNEAAFTMLPGSTIRGNVSSGNVVANDFGAAVHVLSGGSFAMQGGTITGNSATSATVTRTGGLYAVNDATITLSGGSITGNSGNAGDVLAINTFDSITMSGTATVGTLTLNANSATVRAQLGIAAGWTGSVSQFNLQATAPIATVLGWWTGGQAVLTGAGMNADAIGRIALGNFLSNNVANWEAISTTRHINASGVLVLN